MIVKHSTTQQIQEAAEEKGMVLMWEDGFIKCVTGVTTIEEVLRVSKE
jgi:type II secretory ATPase GspE/PulE/Tfp pilus assembly ATPase PilB-like protein